MFLFSEYLEFSYFFTKFVLYALTKQQKYKHTWINDWYTGITHGCKVCAFAALRQAEQKLKQTRKTLSTCLPHQ